MEEKTYSLFPLNEVYKRIVVGSVGIICFVLTLTTYPHGHHPFGFVAMFAILYCMIGSFVDEAKDSSLRTRNGGISVRLWVHAALKILTLAAIIATLIIEGTSIGWFWSIVVLTFLHSAWSNIAVAIRLRQIYAQVDAQIEAERQEKANQETLKRDQAKETRENQKALLESLAFLTDIDPKNK